MNSSILSWNFNTTSQLSKLLGAFNNIAFEFSYRFPGAPSNDSSIPHWLTIIPTVVIKICDVIEIHFCSNLNITTF